ncbi:uncharacterized protein EI97DRAFT_48096 [Westerdykella ornata]|uniref:Aflatoxin regulatory protein domain-containing protein n=1 Tax=Westerdykella ornata TaxID=318751 RepID=A0A6A6JIN5_WESOR|nr:uncharacterized protein EI97DRAFT_48096 [Westerdykella ornata]KAF2276084.1 hypothetical protein EI97DRAFT_48096 [Westerdykella ornata]
MGICCNYSPSMRLGKPRKNRNPDGTIMRDVSPATSCAPLHMGPRPTVIPRTTSYTAESSPEPNDPLFFAPPTPEYPYADAFMANGFDGSQSPYSDEGTFASGWSSEDRLVFQSPTDTFTSVPPITIPTSPFAAHSRTISMHSQPDLLMDGLRDPAPIPSPQFFPSPDRHSIPTFSPDKMALTSPMIPAPLPTPPASASMPKHDCTQFAFQTLNSLHPPPSEPTHGDFNGATGALPTLDTVLSTTKAAVDKLFVLLGCACSTNPHFSTTIAFTIMKVLAWYQAIAVMNHPGAESSINTTMEAFTHTPTSAGDYSREGDDEDTIRTHHVLGELRKIEKLIDRFQDRYCKAASASETGIDASVYASLESLLRTRVRDTFKITMKTAPEDVRRQVASRTHQQQQQQQMRARTMTF